MSTDSPITYANLTAAKIAPLWWHLRGLQQTATGYGRKLTTRYMAKIAGSNRWHRVYCVCFSNSGSLYILNHGKPEYLGVEGESLLEAARDAATV